ncbi:hypothetical protein ACE6H2_020635 [Prunus campanulata]
MWETGSERNIRISSKIVDEDRVYKNEYSNGKYYLREYPPVNRLKRCGTDSSISERKHYRDYGDYPGAKSRRISDYANRYAHLEHYSRRSVERSYRNPPSSRSLVKIFYPDELVSRYWKPESRRKRLEGINDNLHFEISPQDGLLQFGIDKGMVQLHQRIYRKMNQARRGRRHQRQRLRTHKKERGKKKKNKEPKVEA